MANCRVSTNTNNSNKTTQDKTNNITNNNNSILIYFCANSTAQGPIIKLARVDEIYKHTQSTKQGKIIITIIIIIIIIII
jgi:hypothetical protein